MFTFWPSSTSLAGYWESGHSGWAVNGKPTGFVVSDDARRGDQPEESEIGQENTARTGRLAPIPLHSILIPDFTQVLTSTSKSFLPGIDYGTCRPSFFPPC
jgi:hypothetical protein